jgi:hypothetical protein
VRWYLRFKLSLRDLVQMMAERGLSMAHTTIMRWCSEGPLGGPCRRKLLRLRKTASGLRPTDRATRARSLEPTALRCCSSRGRTPVRPRLRQSEPGIKSDLGARSQTS